MERIFYREGAEPAPVLEIFRYQAFRADLDGCLDDQSVAEGEGVLFFEFARGDYDLRFGADAAPLSVGRHDGPRLRPRHGWLEFPGHDGVELLQYLGTEGTATAIPQLSEKRFGRSVPIPGVRVVRVHQDVGVDKRLHRS